MAVPAHQELMLSLCVLFGSNSPCIHMVIALIRYILFGCDSCEQTVQRNL